MRKLIEKFYSFSPLKRFLSLVVLLLLVSAVATGYSFYNLVQALKPLLPSSESPTPKYTTFTQLLAKSSNPFIGQKTSDAFAALDNLEQKTKNLLKSKGFDCYIATHSEELEQEIVLEIHRFNALPWENLIMFTSPQVGPFDESGTISLKSVRDLARFMAYYQIYLKNKHPQEDDSFIFASILKTGRLTEVACPYLIGKMVAIAIDGLSTKTIMKLLDAGAILPAEAKKMRYDLLTSLELEMSFNKSLESEFSFFKHAKGTFYSKAPIALWILDLIFGDPDPQYKKMISMINEPDKMNELIKTVKHPLLQISIPNFRRAREQYLKKLVEKSIICTELSIVAGKLEISIDPYSLQPLKTIEIEGKQRFYSVGPNLKDDKMQNDDIGVSTQ